MKNRFATIHVFIFLLLLGTSSCDDFVKIDPPRTALVKSTVFERDETANAAVVDVYYQLRNVGFASGTQFSLSFIGSLTSDEQINYVPGASTTVAEFQQFNDNTLKQNNTQILSLWTDLYKCLFKTNAILEGLTSSTGVRESLKQQLIGEAKFIRALCNFYLINLWGDIPLLVTTDYRLNSTQSRTPALEVNKQIIDDLSSAQNLLPDTYSFAKNERVRANKGAATALLARAYLFSADWANAEAQATAVIGNSQYSLVPLLVNVFNANGAEAIFQIWSDYLPNDKATFIVDPTGPVAGALRPQFMNAFEAGDLRWTTWGRTRVVSGVTYYYTLKYNSSVFTPPAQYSTVLRVAEQYLIRAEARAQQGNITGAQADVNAIRQRAGLGNTLANDKPTLLTAILQERRSELFTEWGHRWFDLKRTGRADAVLSPLKSQWVSTAVLFPIPESEMINNAALSNAQNPGY